MRPVLGAIHQPIPQGQQDEAEASMLHAIHGSWTDLGGPWLELPNGRSADAGVAAIVMRTRTMLETVFM